MFFPVFLLSVFCVNAEEFHITRDAATTQDVFVVPETLCHSRNNRSICNNYNGDVYHSRANCTCRCPRNDSTFGYFNGKWRCADGAIVRQSAGCKVSDVFSGKNTSLISYSSLTVFNESKYTANIGDDRIINCSTLLQASYQNCLGQWTNVNTNGTDFTFYKEGSRVMAQFTRLIANKENGTAMNGYILKYQYGCRGHNFCLVFKVAGMQKCNGHLKFSHQLPFYDVGIKTEVPLHSTVKTTNGKTSAIQIKSEINDTAPTTIALAPIVNKQGKETPPKDPGDVSDSAITAGVVAGVVLVCIMFAVIMQYKRSRQSPITGSTAPPKPSGAIPRDGPISHDNRIYVEINEIIELSEPSRSKDAAKRNKNKRKAAKEARKIHDNEESYRDSSVERVISPHSSFYKKSIQLPSTNALPRRGFVEDPDVQMPQDHDTAIYDTPRKHHGNGRKGNKKSNAEDMYAKPKRVMRNKAYVISPNSSFYRKSIELPDICTLPRLHERHDPASTSNDDENKHYISYVPSNPGPSLPEERSGGMKDEEGQEEEGGPDDPTKEENIIYSTPRAPNDCAPHESSLLERASFSNKGYNGSQDPIYSVPRSHDRHTPEESDEELGDFWSRDLDESFASNVVSPSRADSGIGNTVEDEDVDKFCKAMASIANKRHRRTLMSLDPERRLRQLTTRIIVEVYSDDNPEKE